MGCERCGSQDVERSGDELICNECGFTRDYSKFKKGGKTDGRKKGF